MLLAVRGDQAVPDEERQQRQGDNHHAAEVSLDRGEGQVVKHLAELKPARPPLLVRPATREDVAKYHPGETCSFRAWVAELDGQTAGIVGLSLTRPIATLFSAFDEALRPHLRHPAVLRAIKWAHLACEAHRGPVAAICSPDEPTAPRLLARLGFEFWAEFDGEQVWILEKCR